MIHFIDNSKMKPIIAAVILILAIVSAQDSPVFDYHRKFGIAEAVRIKTLEEQNLNQKIAGGSLTDISQTPYQVHATCRFFYYVYLPTNSVSLVINIIKKLISRSLIKCHNIKIYDYRGRH